MRSVLSLATRADVDSIHADLRATLAVSRDAVLDRLDRAVRRTVLMLGALLVSAGAAVVFLAWSTS
jgi:hypothetical protein